MALAGVRVLDLTRILAGPFATQMLGSLGARVVKVEHPRGGDPTRAWGPPFTARGRESAYFIGVNCNKQSLALDLKEPHGLATVQALATYADVLIHNFVPGSLDKHGLDYDSLQRRNPGLIYCSISGYGSTGPKAARPGYDVAAAAEGGLLSITGPRHGEAVKVGVAITDICTGLSAVGAIASALYARERDAQHLGQRIDASLLETQVACLANVASSFLVAGEEGERWGTEHAAIVPYCVFRVEDGECVLAATTNAQFATLAEALGLHDLPGDSRFQDNELRVQHREALLAILRDALQHRTLAQVEAMASARKLVFARVKKVSEVFADEQVLHRGMVQEVAHETAGAVKVVGPHVKFSRTPAQVTAPPPTLGAHNADAEAILADWKLSLSGSPHGA